MQHNHELVLLDGHLSIREHLILAHHLRRYTTIPTPEIQICRINHYGLSYKFEGRCMW
jgi:hypothetical protein